MIRTTPFTFPWDRFLFFKGAGYSAAQDVRHITSMAELVRCKRGMLSPGRSMGVYSGHNFKAQCARCFSVTENPKMFIINSVINIPLFVYTLLARGANLKIQAVLNERWQTFLLLIFLFLQNKCIFSDARKTRNKYTRFSHSHIPFVVYFICVREKGGITYYQVISQNL